MATLDATPAGPAANSYTTRADAMGFLSERLDTVTWMTAPATVQDTSLIWATRLLDEQVQWVGWPSTTTQALGWPRSGVYTRTGQAVDSTTVPEDIQRATALYARALVSHSGPSAASGGSGSAGQQVRRRQLGDTSIEYFQQGGANQAAQSPVTTIPAEVRQLLRGYGLVLSGVCIPVVRT